MRAGISSFAFGWAVAQPGLQPFSMDALLDFAVAHDVPVIQFGDHLPLHRLPSSELRAFSDRARTAGVEVEVGGRGLTAAHLSDYLKVAHQLDSRLLRFVIDQADHEPTADFVTGLIREAVPELRAAGVVLGLENHDRFPASTLRRIVDEIDSEWVGVCLDTANSLGAGEGIGEILPILSAVCVNLHLKDYTITRLPHQMGFTVTGSPLGRGHLPLDHVLAIIAARPRCTTAALETWPPPEADDEATLAKERRWAADGVAVLKSALLRLPSRS